MTRGRTWTRFHKLNFSDGPQPRPLTYARSGRGELRRHKMNRIAKYAGAAALTGALALAAATPGQARDWHHHNGAAVLGGFAAGAILGAAAAGAASDNYYYGSGPYYGGYSYEPGYAYEPSYAYSPGYAYEPSYPSETFAYSPSYD